MTRLDQIKELQARYLVAVAEKKRKTAAILYARLQSLMTRELRAENKASKRRAA